MSDSVNMFDKPFTCPSCKHEMTAHVLYVVDCNKYPELYPLLKNLDIYKIKCENCGAEHRITYDTLVLDPAHNTFLYFLTDPSKEMTFRHQIKYFIESVLNKDDKYDLSKLHTRLVFSQNDLVEKLTIFETGLDDEAIEILKSSLYDKELVDRNVYDRLYFSGLNNSDLSFLAFNSKSSTVEVKQFVLGYITYNKVVDAISSTKVRHRDDFEVIDSNWVSQNFKQKDNK